MKIKAYCKMCGQPYMKTNGKSMFCSDACKKARVKQRYERDRDKRIAYTRQWQNDHPEAKDKFKENHPNYDRDRSRKIRGSKEYARECIVCGKAFTTWLPQKKTCSDECKTIHKKERDKGRGRSRKRTPEEEHERWIIRRYGSEDNYQKWLAEQESLKREMEQRREQERQSRKEAYENQLEEWRIAREARKEANHRKDFCIVCGKEYETYNPAQKTCSKECGKKLAHAHKHKRIPKSQLVDKDITLEALYRRDSGVCYLCGKKCDWNDKTDKSVGPAYPSIDHMIPIAKGGLHAWTNVKLAHFECNWKKSDALLPSLSSTG